MTIAGADQISFHTVAAGACVELRLVKEDHMNMLTGEVAPHFWAAVEDCLVTFHQLKRCEAAERVTSLWRRIPTKVDESKSFADMIYHAEPWRIACNLAHRDLEIAEYQGKYQEVLKQNGLISD
jgi:hypothetical protein